MKEKSKWIWLLVLTIVLVAVLYTDPLVLNLSTQFPGFRQTDTYLSVWNIWHLKKTLFSGHDFFALTSDYTFYPQKPSLALHNYMITSGLMSLLFQLVFSPIVSMNLIFFIQFILTGLGMYFLVFYFTQSRIAGFWSGITLAFCPYVIINSCYFLHFSTIWFFPWFIYFLWRFLDSGALKYSCLAALVYALSLLEDQTYFFFLTILTIFLIILRAVEKTKPREKNYIKNSLVGAVIFFVIALPYLWKTFIDIKSATTSFPVWPDPVIDYFSLHITNLFRPSPLLSVYKELPYLSTPMMHVSNIFVGYVPLFFALIALLNLRNFAPEKRRIIIFWLLTGGFFFLIALGPKPLGNNQFLNKFSFYNILCTGVLRQLRIPERFALVTLLAIYILAAFGIERFMRFNRSKLLSNKSLGLFLVGLQIIEFMPMPYPLLYLKVPKVYYDLASRAKGAPILVLPLGWQNSYKTLGGYYKEIQFYQTIHEHPIFQGQIARIEERYFDFYLSQPGFKFLMDAEKRKPLPGEKEGVFGILRKYNIKYVVIHTQYFDKSHLDGLREMFKDYPGELFVEYAG
ncbi:MAG: hypothetical protein NTY14_08465 [Candidatus Omnitrophica bacterium]|nr:hypothetical protein [Candidatus Omnitrophota bacterium]